MGQPWWSALGSGLRKFPGGKLVESVKDYVRLMHFSTIFERLDV